LTGIDRDIGLLAAYWRYIKSGQPKTEGLENFVSSNCKDCVNDLSNIIENHNKRSNTESIDDKLVDQAVKGIDILAQKISHYIEKFKKGSDEAYKAGKNKWVEQLFSPINKLEKYLSVTDDENQAFEFIATFSAASFLQKIMVI
jgi:transcriptional regulator of heat shock response